MFENHRWKNKDKYKGAFILFCIQLIFFVGGFFLLKNFYTQITVEDGITEKHSSAEYIQEVKSDNINFKPAKIETNQNKLLYEGIFGKLKISRKELDGTTLSHKTMILQEIYIDDEKLKNFLYAKQLYKTNNIDPYFVNFITNQKGDYTFILSDLSFLQKKLQKKIISEPKEDIKTQLQILTKYIEQEQFDKAISFLNKEDNEFQDIIKNTKKESDLSLDTSFTSTNEFKYLLNKLDVDNMNFYADHIKTASKTFGIEPELIKAAILTEQLRGFFTYRGLMKHLIGGQTYMMVMSQSSRGIGGIKEKTAKKIEKYISKKYPSLYTKRFELMSLNKKEERFQRLTNQHDYFYQIMYVAANLKMNIDLREDANMSIVDKPGIILTLYNIGSKNPHPNPDIGGADLNINGKRYSFGSLGMLLYYYMKVY